MKYKHRVPTNCKKYTNLQIWKHPAATNSALQLLKRKMMEILPPRRRFPPIFIWPKLQNQFHPLLTCTVQASWHIAPGAPSMLGPHQATAQAAWPAGKFGKKKINIAAGQPHKKQLQETWVFKLCEWYDTNHHIPMPWKWTYSGAQPWTTTYIIFLMGQILAPWWIRWRTQR